MSKRQLDLDVLHDTHKLHRLVLPLHRRWIKPVSTILELDNEAFRIPYSQIILGTQILQRLKVYKAQ